ncbi:uncharacterized protein LOC131430770 [Malaya genurostris]|uniref:uncharacterized protein LOC131430770 n=1 Tax=Malaya genurostris TaxID=325434 RepID=UPI0026F3E2E2|nr:uncharacterized protein LOC131430770 [Malaya genurostris]
MNFDRFTLISNEVVEFKSTWRTDETVTLTDSSIGTDPPPPKHDAETIVVEQKHIGTQTDEPSQEIASCDDAKLSHWLRKVYPLVEEELSYGITEVYDENENLSEIGPERPIIRKHQQLTLQKFLTDQNNTTKFNTGSATWLSIRTRDAPLLVVSCSQQHEAWCEHTYASVTVFTPKRDSFDSVQWVELCSNPVKACIETLVTNPFNKDVLAGGTVSGDVYIWQYEQNLKNEQNSFAELFSETTDYGKVVDMAWMKPYPLSDDFGLLSCHTDGIVILWKVGKHIVKDKTLRFSASSTSREDLLLTRILTITDSKFVIGADSGHIRVCWVTQLTTVGQSVPGATVDSTVSNQRSLFTPSMVELKSHSFAVTTLQNIENPNKKFLLSCDLTGEVYFHDTTDVMNSTPSLIIKMSLPFKNRIFCTDDMRFILSPRDNGTLEVYNIDDGSREIIENSELIGRPSFIKTSANKKWIVTGPYDGAVTIYSMKMDV